MNDPWRDSGAAPADALEPPRRRWWLGLAFALLLGLALVWPSVPTQPTEMLHVQDRRPPILMPTGALLGAYEGARPATLRIEVRCVNVRGGGSVLGVGSGFFFTADAEVLTAYHVVDTTQARDCAVEYVGVDPQRREYRLELVGFDAYLDLAVMRARDTRDVPFIPVAERLPKPGTEVVAIGNSGQDFLAPRAGVVTRLGVRSGRADFADNTIELTNSLAPGDSGGPVLTADGQAVGVVSYISFNPAGMRSDSVIPPFLMGVPLPQQFAAYAVPVAADPELIGSLQAGAQRDVPVIGFTWQNGFDYDPTRSDVDLGPRPGPIVGSVAAGGPAAAAGLRPYSVEPLLNEAGERIGSRTLADVIVAIDGVSTPTFASLLAEIRSKSIGQVVVLTVQRGGATYRISLELAPRRVVFAGR
jgi:S1-C subfamily serine protease